jgi:hypothetical protein
MTQKQAKQEDKAFIEGVLIDLAFYAEQSKGHQPTIDKHLDIATNSILDRLREAELNGRRESFIQVSKILDEANIPMEVSGTPHWKDLVTPDLWVDTRLAIKRLRELANNY